MTHINPTLPVVGSPSWGVPLNGTLSAIINGVNDLDDLATSIETFGAADYTRMRFMGAWVASTAYSTNDVVSYNGSAYVSKTDHNSGSSFTGAGTNWALLARGSVVSTTAPTAPLVGDQWVDTN